MAWAVLFWVLVAALALALVSRLFPGDDTARGALRERLARGEIPEAEYRERMKFLDASRKSSTGYAPLVVVLLVALGVLVLMAGFRGMPGWMHGMPGMGGMPHMRGWTPAPASPPAAWPGGRTTPVTLVEFAFRPDSVRVRSGEGINLRVSNSGHVTHDLYVPALGFQVTVQPGQVVVAALPPAAPGSYEFYCTLPGHREAGMRGTLVVVPSVEGRPGRTSDQPTPGR
ncbi:MAG: cupredoxin domain-containing protein [Armatimonadota bacterium]|nr:cupredoxin domain-containing protein [Armatimonadota bacterium]MDW8156319.1 cupredoxin domain-containing protein [Armatimonadota bacterium]